jgi:lactate permease
VLALVPILLILFLMLGARWSAARAGTAGFLAALALAWLVFGYGQIIYPEAGAVWGTTGAMAEAIWTAATILWIIFPALCIHQLQARTGAIEVLRQAMGRLSDDPRLIVILVAWFFALFIEGAAGFGTTVALAAPFLVGVGFRPVDAVTVALIGHAVGVSFGAVGTPILPQMAATGFGALELARASALYHSVLGWVMLVLAMRLVNQSLQERGGGSGRGSWRWVALGAFLFLAPFTAIAIWLGPELPTLGGALLGGLGFVVVLSLTQPAGAQSREASNVSAGQLARAGAPYLTLVLLILLTRLVPPLREALTGYVWEWTLLGRFEGRFMPLYHPGTMLMSAFFLGALWQRARMSEVRAAAAHALRQLGPVTVALVMMLALSRIMVHAGMIEALALAAASLMGGAWPVVAPFVGVLGTFVTGSATASNILFTDFQYATAQNLELAPLPMMGAQGFGAAVGNIISPHNIIAGGATVGIAGEEGRILRRTLAPCLIYGLLGGALAMVLTLL